MHYQALYRKYRPKNFEDVVGQEVIVKTIRTALKNDKLSHAYLFSGPRGTGKTTIAKLIAKTVNCLSYPTDVFCNECDNCKLVVNEESSDIIEIDAASNNGVDEVRELKNKISLVPSFSKYKVYIIDEVHMLSIGAFNALLKTLEEPPSHVIFILATTEFHKIPETIVSRCQVFEFKKLSLDSMVRNLIKIAEKEKINITEEALNEIALIADGGMRDVINMLDQLVAFCDDEITIDDVHSINGTISKEKLINFIDNILKGNFKDVLELLNDLDNTGKDLIKIVDEIIKFLKTFLIDRLLNNLFKDSKNNKIIALWKKEDVYFLLDKMIEVSKTMQQTSYQKTVFEIALIKVMDISFADKDITENTNYSIENKEETKKEAIQKDEITIDDNKKETENNHAKLSDSQLEELKKIRINNTLALADKNILEELKDIWTELASYSIDPFLGPVAGLLLDGVLRAASENNVIISYPYEALASRVNIEILKVEKLLFDLTKRPLKIIAISEAEWLKTKDDYIDKVRRNEKLQVMEEVISVEDLFLEEEEKEETKEVIQNAIDLFGDDIIEIN